jgi:trehalose 6-phosphate synthase
MSLDKIVEGDTGWQSWQSFLDDFFAERSLIIAANRGPVTFQTHSDGSRTFDRGSGGLVTALLGLTRHVDATWIACARTDADADWEEGKISLMDLASDINVQFLAPEESAYEKYYNVIANPLIWFLQHGMWDIPRQPIIDLKTWKAWEEGYVTINQLFADAIVAETKASKKKPLVMLQDYHLYLTARLVRNQLPPAERPTMLHFVHIPWPGPDYWAILPQAMRNAVLEGLLGADLIGFQTDNDALNFARTCREYLSRVGVKYREGRIWYRNHVTYTKAFPIAIDVHALRNVAQSALVQAERQAIDDIVGDKQLILRIERSEPSKNILRGFEAYGELLALHPELHEKVVFLAILVPSRMDLDEYKWYLGEVMAAIGRINAEYGSGSWEPVRALMGENYHRAVAAMKRYDVLLVNSIVDGMNLVAKEGPILNERAGRLVLSERTGAREQLESAAIVISPYDVYATSRALHQALTMPADECHRRAAKLCQLIEQEDIGWWIQQQLQAVEHLNL